MAKQAKFGANARQSLLSGIKFLADCVTTTMGPTGQNVAIDRKWNAPKVLHDGVSVSREVELPDPFENMGAQMVKEAADKTVDGVGDGTTTATLLAYQIVKKGIEYLDQTGVLTSGNGMVMQEGIKKATAIAVQTLRDSAKELKSKEEIAQIATISSADLVLGNIIAEAMEKVGRDGVIATEKNLSPTTVIEYRHGMQIDKGFISPYFMTNEERKEAELLNPLILITTEKIVSNDNLMNLFKQMKDEGKKDLFIIADNVEGDPLGSLIVNKSRGTLNVCAINAPSFGDRRRTLLEDIAVLTGGKVITKETGLTLDNFLLSDCGLAQRVIVKEDSTQIIEGAGDKEVIKERVEHIKAQIKETVSEFEKDKLKERAARLSTGVAIIKVGATTEIEAGDKEERVKDAVSATKSAVEEGIIVGGGIALMKAIKPILEEAEKETNPDIKQAMKIVAETLKEPLLKLIDNSGASKSEVTKKIEAEQTNGNYEFGYNVVTKEFGNMFTLGVIDPLKVTRSAIENAASVAAMVLTTDVLITDIPEEKKEN